MYFSSKYKNLNNCEKKWKKTGIQNKGSFFFFFDSPKIIIDEKKGLHQFLDFYHHQPNVENLFFCYCMREYLQTHTHTHKTNQTIR